MAKKSVATPAPAEVVKPVETAPAVVYVTSTELAERLGTKPTILRRWLRTLPMFQDSGYTRYKWEEGDQFLKDAAASFEKHQKADSEKKAARLEEARQKAAKKADDAGDEKPVKTKKAKKTEPEPEPEAEDEEEIFTDDEEGEEGEELE